MLDQDGLRNIRHLAKRDDPRRMKEEDVWNILAIIAIIATLTLISLPLMDFILNDRWVRFASILVLLFILAMIALRMVLPKRSPYHDVPEEKETPTLVSEDGSMRRALKGDHDDQLRQYRELQIALGRRIMTRRRMDDASWREIRKDPDLCMSILGDHDLTDLAMAELIGVSNVNRLRIYGLAFDDDFESRFEGLLKKVEDLR
jgi:hypothetical protein